MSCIDYLYMGMPSEDTFKAAENRKSLLTVTQFELAYCIFEHVIKGKTSFLKKITKSIWPYRKPFENLFNETFIRSGEREVTSSIPGRDIPKSLKMVPAAPRLALRLTG